MVEARYGRGAVHSADLIETGRRFSETALEDVMYLAGRVGASRVGFGNYLVSIYGVPRDAAEWLCGELDKVTRNVTVPRGHPRECTTAATSRSACPYRAV